ncbi:ABC transporter permease [Carnobacterium gallinarum]|uniref:ABC transporter permease n=1 Tax=Carnobacterium gallinarum TaxID=2749 RepID=UPI0005505207|nr:ABC transporter permease [Carnobacterium gallinarum]
MYKHKWVVFLLENTYSRHFFSFLFLFSLFLATLTSWSILTSLDSFRNESLNKDSSVVTVEFDMNSIVRDNIKIEAKNFTHPTKNEYEKIAKLPEVESAEINFHDILLSPNLMDISEEGSSNIGLFSIKGINTSQPFDVKFNNIKIVEGRTFNNSEISNGINSILISSEVAKKNQLSVNDNFVLNVSNPYDPSQIYIQNMKIVGIFSPNGYINSKKIESQNLLNLLKDVFHSPQEETAIPKTTTTNEFENIIILQKNFLLEDLNTIYTPNKTSEMLIQSMDKQFQTDTTSSDYQASYILKSSKSMEDFKLKAEKILPKYFTIYDIKDAYTSWLPYTARNMMLIEGLILLLLFISLILFTFTEIIEVTKNKYQFTQHLLLGKTLSHPNNIFLKKEILFITSILIPTTLIAP